MALLVALLLVLLASPAVHAVDHVVGDSTGWNLQGDYKTWAAGQTFTVGDNLVFNYDSSHGVVQLGPADYNSCNTGNALKSYNGGSTTIPLTQAGAVYFACPSFGHCGSGMKLAINVQATGGSSGTPTTPSGGSAIPTAPTTSTPDNVPSYIAAAGSFRSTNLWMLGISSLLVALFACQG